MISFFFGNIPLIYKIILSFLTAAILTIGLSKYFVAMVLNLKQPIRNDGPTEHLKKQGTPSLGGVLILICFVISLILWIGQINLFIISILLVILIFAIIGFIDDYLKLVHKNSKGLSGKIRLLVGFLVSCYAVYNFTQAQDNLAHSINWLFSSNNYVYIGLIGTLLFGSFVLVGTANSVNLTDGLDGLASLIAFTVLAFFLAYILLIINNFLPNFSNNFSNNYINNIKEITVIIAILMGCILGFLWINCSPAQIFMGDVGSLSIGGAIGAIAVALKQEFLLAITGFIFVLESISVILQVYYFKLSKGKRLFLMAPLHHHFEKKGIKETKVVLRMWILTVLSCIFGILILLYFGR